MMRPILILLALLACGGGAKSALGGASTGSSSGGRSGGVSGVSISSGGGDAGWGLV